MTGVLMAAECVFKQGVGLVHALSLLCSGIMLSTTLVSLYQHMCPPPLLVFVPCAAVPACTQTPAMIEQANKVREANQLAQQVCLSVCVWWQEGWVGVWMGVIF